MPDQYAYAQMLALCLKIQEHVNAQYTRGEDGRLYPTFPVPRCDMAFVEVYRESFEGKTGHKGVTYYRTRVEKVRERAER